MSQPNYHDGGWPMPTDEPRFNNIKDCDECPGKYDPPGHLKLKTEKLCPYCSLKEYLEWACR